MDALLSAVGSVFSVSMTCRSKLTTDTTQYGTRMQEMPPMRSSVLKVCTGIFDPHPLVLLEVSHGLESSSLSPALFFCLSSRNVF